MSSGRKDDAQELKELLVERKRQLWANLREEVFRTLGENVASQYDIPQDNGESSMLDALSDEGLAVADIHRAELTNLEEAERTLEMGTYGLCQECGEPIGPARLRLVPFASYCVRCQSKVEGEGPLQPARPKL
jgi:DnaK suppressor protein